jgi:hypothetical protein
MIAYANHPQNNADEQSVILVNLKEHKEQAIYSTKENIDDVKISTDWIYWVIGEDPISWKVMAYSFKSKEIKTIKESKNENYTLVPRINNDNNMLYWMEGLRNNAGKLLHTIYRYNPDSNEVIKVTNVNYVDNPYQILIPRNNYLCIPDKVNNTWAIRILNIQKNNELVINCETIPTRPVKNDKFLLWTEGDPGQNKLILYNIEKKEKEIIEANVDYAEIVEGNVIYSSTFQIYKYVIDTKKTVCLTKDLIEQNLDVSMWFSYDKNTIISIQKKGPGTAKIAIINDNSNAER